ncbi:FMN-binding protein [Dactylosporangium sp. CA-139114]|uniref:FMN-binding protein n=1 Tax=Dactylosporangium sp. CA-139114 TaxID=3239931 RepID=UPI003D978A17
MAVPAAPRLREQALQRQSADLDTVSGATYGSDGYRRSLQSAIDAARGGRPAARARERWPTVATVIERERPPDRVNVTLNVGGDDLGVPFLTKAMLDLWVHALHGANPFLIVGRPGDDRRFIQTYRNAPDDYTLEHRDGAEADLVSTVVDAPAKVVELIWGWIRPEGAGR